MTATLDAARAKAYRRIFAHLPRNFLDPRHPNNELVVGALAHGLALTTVLYEAAEAGLFLDTAGQELVADVHGDGLAPLQRWALWLDVPLIAGEDDARLRSRIMAKLYSPRLTIAAIEDAVSRATGRTVRVQESYEQVARFNAGPFGSQRIAGSRFNWGRIEVVTELEVGDPPLAGTSPVSALLREMRAAGIYWRHLERTRGLARLEWETLGSATWAARSVVRLWSQGLRPNQPAPWRPTRRFWHLGGTLAARGHAVQQGGGAMLLAGPAGGPLDEVLARHRPAGTLVLTWDDTRSHWDETDWNA